MFTQKEVQLSVVSGNFLTPHVIYTGTKYKYLGRQGTAGSSGEDNPQNGSTPPLSAFANAHHHYHHESKVVSRSNSDVDMGIADTVGE
jgi:hypothetical protein